MTALYNIGDFVEFVERPRPIAKPAPLCHYMLRMHPKFDLKAERRLHAVGIEAYVPKEKRSVKGVWNRSVLKDVPIFPGVMFIPDFHADLPRLKSIADGIGGFVKVSGTALKVTPVWMERIRAFEAKQQLEGGKRKFQVGQDVRIVGGVYDMWEGKVARVDRHARLKVLIRTVAGEVSVELGEDQVEAV
jgi:transcription antitermination factor NusG